MKNLLFICFAFISVSLLLSCHEDPKPGEAAKVYMEYLKDGKYDDFVAGIAFENEEDVKEQRDMSVALLKEKGKDIFKDNDGLKSIDVISEDISADGNSAKVVLKLTYGNGEVEDSTMDMVKKDGAWKMVNKK